MSVNSSPSVVTPDTQALQARVKELEAQLADKNTSQPVPQAPKDGVTLSTLKGAGAAGLAAAIPAVPIAGWMIKTAGSGTGGLGQAMMGMGIGIAGVGGAALGGGIAANTADGSMSKGAAHGAIAGGIAGGVIMTMLAGGRPNVASLVGAGAFAAAGAIGGAIGSRFSE